MLQLLGSVGTSAFTYGSSLRSTPNKNSVLSGRNLKLDLIKPKHNLQI